MNDKVFEIRDLMNSRKMIEAKEKIDELGNDLDKLQEFFDEIKKLCRNQGKSNMVSVQSLEGLLKEYGR